MLDAILQAADRIEGKAHKTPIMTSEQFNDMIGAEIYIKCENLQKGGAFKFRGAFNTISQLTKEQKEIGIITHSSGNHAQAVAKTGQILGIKTVIVMPENAPEVKVSATKGYGAEVVFCENTQEARVNKVNDLMSQHGYCLVHPFDNENIIAGAGTTAKEMFEEIGNLDIIMAPVGGGGLISGVGNYTKLSGKECLVYAAEPRGANDAKRSLDTGNHVKTQKPNTIADGLRTTLSDRTWSYVSKYVDKIIEVTDRQIIQAMRFLFERLKIVVEPSGAVPIAAIMSNINLFSGKKIGVIISGGNVDMNQFFESLTIQDE